MAEKRMISKVISISKKVNLQLDNHFARLLYTWMIPHADDFGRMQGDPHQVKSIVIPMLDDTWRDVEKALHQLDQAGLIHWYEVDDDKYVQLINFDTHQSGLHKRTKSKFPEFPGNSKKLTEIPLEGKGTEQKRNRTEEEGKGTELPSVPSDNPHQDYILKIINENQINYSNFYTLEKIYSYIGAIDIEVIEAAVKKSTGKQINYCLATLEGMIREGTTKKSQLYKPAQPSATPKRGTGKPQIQAVTNQQTSVSADEIEEIKRKAKQLDIMFHNPTVREG